MNSIKKDILKAFISWILIIIAYYLGYTYAVKKYSYHQENPDTKYVEIQTSKNAIKIVSIDPWVDIIVDGQKTHSGSINLE